MVVHWMPTSDLGGLEVALLTFLREAAEVDHTIVTGEASGPAAELSDSAKLFMASREIDKSMGKKDSSRELIFCKTKCS